MDLHFDRLCPPKEEEDDERESVQIKKGREERKRPKKERMRKRKESLQENAVAVCVKDSGLWGRCEINFKKKK